MWWLDAVADGFRYPYASIQICAFRVVLATAMLVKFAYEHHRGAWRYFAPDSYVYFRFRREHPGLPIDQRWYRVLYGAKLVAAGCLLVGVLPRVAAVVAALWFFFELCYDRKFHTAYLGLCALFLAASPVLGDALTYHTVVAVLRDPPREVLWEEAGRTGEDAFAQVLLVLLTVQMYLSSAYRKLRSAHFMTGGALHDFTASLHADRHAQRYRDTWYPPVMVRTLIDVPVTVARKRWRWAAVATVVVELLLPVTLLVPGTYLASVVVGALMHAAFTAVLPVRLIPFSVATVGSYLLFADPANVLASLAAR
ncbi:hypothetical protein QQG74_20540 [Micromonospora sp. FIMYZ51]|uniref:hypothetical protein n=1 Tax=Micromonospora sp. FIMYZ51 TaxID=3051832 RepID=UPI00311D2F07